MNRDKTFHTGSALLAALVLGAVLLASAGGALAAGAAELLPAGQAAPLFQGVDIDGQPYSLEEALSRGAVFLVFWSIF